MAEPLPELIVADAAAWRDWLRINHANLAGVRLVLAKKGTTEPTSLTYDDALDEALSHGWIDGQTGRRDDATFRRMFTPRRARSGWSARNVMIIDRLRSEGRMHPAGEAEVARAQADGRWDAAYAGQATIEIPEDLAAALRANPLAQAMFDALNSQNRYAILYRTSIAKRAATRARKIEQFVAMLSRGETIHPQKQSAPGRKGPAG
ncbi:MAG TPA: YdeI/OmpD-associated family protein [Candidatus Dormibacteraeota bacterium]